MKANRELLALGMLGRGSRPTPPPPKPGAGTLYAPNFSALADMLSSPSLLGRPVLDKTGLTGNYLIDIQYGPDEDVVTIVQDQGLRIEAVKGPVGMMVIDHVEKPDANYDDRELKNCWRWVYSAAARG
jgi:uncharacterized protein (TIGR03435 family)